ncbi:hypothetical protein PDESU_05600 [Pontiella desulfatans]|uniref:Toxin HigB-2 n=1 Tax=Pontiella desulfatans TaxID=2750659 RepID=A0A6C2UCQ1_PONDE|nr:hypothetical protein [Pontiella desulfatans]VGO17006.1 hypothetical protein PDESU_05600 [Pontiella desulfatans]
MWGLAKAEGFDNNFKKFARKHRAESAAVMANLETALAVLNETNNVQAVRELSFSRKEPDGILALDSRGAKRERTGTKLKTTRLYIYTVEINSTLYLLRIGDKDSQQQDLKTCRNAIRRIKRELER